MPQLYDPLLRLDHEGKIQLVLAEEVTPDKTGRTWTIKIREGVKFHDGRTLEAADVLYSLKRIADGQYFGNAYIAVPINFAASRVVDATTLQVAFDSPNAIFDQSLGVFWQFYIVPRDYDPKRPIGTGPFTLKSFTPGVESTTVRFDDYWDEGKPYLDSIVTLNMADETTQANALSSGEVDVINFLSAQSVKQLQESGAVVTVSQTTAWAPITMRVDVAPFDDIRVRQALRLVVDRQQMVDVVFEGLGSVAYDVFGVTDPLSSFDEKRDQDIEQAKSLLRSAGHSDLQLEFISNDNPPFQKSVAPLFAEQAKAAGVDIRVKFQPASEFYAGSYLTVPFSQDVWYSMPYLSNVAGATLKTGSVNATHFDDPEYQRLFDQAVATTDGQLQADMVNEMQMIDFERGGNIIPFYYPTIDAASTNIGGLAEDASGFPLGNYDWKNIWRTS